MRGIFFASFLLVSTALFVPNTASAQQYKCAFDSQSSCRPCTQWGSGGDMGACQSSFSDNVCNNGLNPCIVNPPTTGCAERGGSGTGGLGAQPIQTCPIPTPTVDPTDPTPTINPFITPTPTTPPVALNCDNLDTSTQDWQCVDESTAIPGNWLCNPPGYAPKPATNPYDVHCTAQFSASYWCCTHVVGCGPLGTNCPTPIPQSLCTPPNVDPITGYNTGVSTPFGCLPYTGDNGPAKITIEVLSNWAVVIAAGVAIFIILFAAVQITTATGDPKRLKAGQELLFSGLAGIFLVGIAIVLLNFLGVKVLGLDLLGFIL